MKPTNETQAGAAVPVQLSLPAGAFNQELTPIIGGNKVGWSPDDHLRFVEALMTRLQDENGDAANFNQAQQDRLRLVFHPTEDLQRSVLRQTFAEAGYALNPDTEKAVFLLLSGAQFATFLAKTDNPSTKKPFITLEKKRGVKKATFSNLIAAEPESAAKSKTEPAPKAATEEATAK
jgi:hypothetical protein